MIRNTKKVKLLAVRSPKSEDGRSKPRILRGEDHALRDRSPKFEAGSPMV